MEPKKFDEQHFKRFFSQVNGRLDEKGVWHGHEPFPSQVRLARSFFDGTEPDLSDLPTSSGKTAVVETSLYTLAVRGPDHFYRRIVHNTNRRVCVDDTYVHAQRVLAEMKNAGDNKAEAKEVYDKLCSIGGGEPLLCKMRGGLLPDRRWVELPERVAVIVSTTDQIGSRLLFRGFCCGRKYLMLEAALLAYDSFIINDEAHLSHAFHQSMKMVSEYLRAGPGTPVTTLKPFKMIGMTATPRLGEPTFRLNQDDWDHPILGKRLKANKYALLTSVTVPKGAKRKDVIGQALADGVFNLLDATDGLIKKGQDKSNKKGKVAMDWTTRLTMPKVLLVVGNSVLATRKAEDLIRARLAASDSKYKGRSILLIGPSRPEVRDALMAGNIDLLRAERDRSGADILIVVATQCVEAGADIDCDAIVTECAAYDAVRQRFGRNDRVGHQGYSLSLIICVRRKDPIYGPATETTSKFLYATAVGTLKVPQIDAKAVPFVNMGIKAMEDLWKNLPPDVLEKFKEKDKATPDKAQLRQEMTSRADDAPTLTPSVLDALIQTCPFPKNSPSIEKFLHGRDSDEPTVRIIWRADLPMFDDADDEKKLIEQIREGLEQQRPSSREEMELSLKRAKYMLSRSAMTEAEWFLDGGYVGDESDMLGRMVDESSSFSAEGSRKVFRWDHEDSKMIDIADIGPNDIIVLPSSAGGCDEYGWNPFSKKSVLDIADRCFNARGEAKCLRFHDRIFKLYGLELPNLPELVRKFVAEGDSDEVLAKVRQMLGMVSEIATSPDVGWVKESADCVLAAKDIKLCLTPDEKGILVKTVSKGRTKSNDVTLDDHNNDVANEAVFLSKLMRLRDDLAQMEHKSGLFHDVAKVYPPWQHWLGGNKDALNRGLPSVGTPLAKTKGKALSWREMRPRPRQTADGKWVTFRHEVPGAAMVLQSGHEEGVAYLGGVHHGKVGRPFIPFLEDKPGKISHITPLGKLTSDMNHGLWKVNEWPEKFWRMVRAHGYWGLALLEGILILADERASKAEGGRAEGDDDEDDYYDEV